MIRTAITHLSPLKHACGLCRPRVRHYLPLVPVPQTVAYTKTNIPRTASSIAAFVECGGNATLVRQRTNMTQPQILGTQALPAGCGCHDSNTVHPAQVSLFAGSVLTHHEGNHGNAPPLMTRLSVFCDNTAETTASINITSVYLSATRTSISLIAPNGLLCRAELGLDFHDQHGLGSSVGETVLALPPERHRMLC